MWVSLEESGDFSDIPHLFHFLELLFVALVKAGDPKLVTRISFPQWPGETWKGKNGIHHNEWIIYNIWPKINIGPGEGLPDLVVDRAHMNKANINKAWAKYIRQFDPYKWSGALTIPSNPSQLPRVTYIDRQGASRRKLDPEVHENFVKIMQRISGIEFLDIQMEKLEWEEQVKISRGTDLLIGVHGNGMSHAAFMHPHRNVVEIFIQGITFEWDYYTLSKMMGHEYMCIFNSGICMPQMFVRNRWARCTSCNNIPIPPIIAIIDQIKEEHSN